MDGPGKARVSNPRVAVFNEPTETGTADACNGLKIESDPESRALVVITLLPVGCFSHEEKLVIGAETPSIYLCT